MIVRQEKLNNMKETYLYDKENGLKTVDDLLNDGYKFNGLLDMHKEDMDKNLPSIEDEYSAIPMYFIECDEENKTFNFCVRFFRISKKDLAKALKMENHFQKQRTELLKKLLEIKDDNEQPYFDKEYLKKLLT